MAQFDAHRNNAYSTVAVAPDPADAGLTLSVESGHGARFPAAPFNVTVWRPGESAFPAEVEVLRVTEIDGDDFTVARGQEDTAPFEIEVGDYIAATITAKTITDIESATDVFGGPDDGEVLFWDSATAKALGSPNFTYVEGTGITLGSGQILAPDGTYSAPSYSFASDTDTGFYSFSGGSIGVGSNGNPRFVFSGAQLLTGSTGSYAFSSAGAGTVADVILYRDDAGALALRRSTSPNEFRVYGTYTDASNYRRVTLKNDGTNGYLKTEASGTSSDFNLAIQTSQILVLSNAKLPARSWNISFNDSSVPLWPGLDNVYDIGQSVNRPRYIYWGTQALAPDGTDTAPSYSFASDSTFGIFSSSIANKYVDVVSNQLRFYNAQFNTASVAMIGSGGGSYVAGRIKVGNGSLEWTATHADATTDLALYRDDAGTLAQRNSTNAQALRIYNTYTDASNYRRLTLRDSYGPELIYESAGSGVGARDMYVTNSTAGRVALATVGVSRWEVLGADDFNFRPCVDATYDIGSTFQRIRTGYFGGAAASIPLTIKLHASQSANAFQIFDSSDNNKFSVGPTGDVTVTQNTYLYGLLYINGVYVRGSTNIWEQRNGANAQTFRIYNTYTDASNYERFSAYWSSNQLYLYGEQAGSGTSRAIRFGTTGTASLYFTSNNSERLQLDQYGHFSPVADASQDLGGTSKRFRALYLGGTAASIPAVIKLHASQTANALEIQNSSSTVLSKITPEGDVFGKGQGFATVAKTTTYTVAAGDHVVRCDASGGAFTVNLPAAASHTGRIVHIKKTDSSANVVTIDGNSSETIDGATTQQLVLQYESLMLQCNGTSWDVI